MSTSEWLVDPEILFMRNRFLRSLDEFLPFPLPRNDSRERARRILSQFRGIDITDALIR